MKTTTATAGPEAPYGRKQDGTPKRKPGRPSNGNGSHVRAVRRQQRRNATSRAAANGKPAITTGEATSLLDRIQAECDTDLREFDAKIADRRTRIGELEAEITQIEQDRSEVERIRKALDV